MWFKGFILTLYFLILCAGTFPGPYSQCGNRVPFEKADVSLRCFPACSCLLPKRKALSPRNSWTFSYMLPYTWEMMFVGISLDCVVSQRPLCGTLFRLPWTLSLMFPYSRGMMIMLRRPLQSVVSDRNGLGISVPLPPAVLRGFTHEANIALEAGLAKFCFSVLCSSCFPHSNNATWFLTHVL